MSNPRPTKCLKKKSLLDNLLNIIKLLYLIYYGKICFNFYFNKYCFIHLSRTSERISKLKTSQHINNITRVSENNVKCIMYIYIYIYSVTEAVRI